MYFDFSDNKFVKAKGFGHEITVNSTGEPIVALENGDIIHKRGAELLKLNGFARDISVSSDNDIWIVGEEKVTGGYEVFRGKLGLSIQWENMNAGAIRVATVDQNTSVIVNEWGEVYKLSQES